MPASANAPSIPICSSSAGSVFSLHGGHIEHDSDISSRSTKYIITIIHSRAAWNRLFRGRTISTMYQGPLSRSAPRARNGARKLTMDWTILRSSADLFQYVIPDEARKICSN